MENKKLVVGTVVAVFDFLVPQFSPADQRALNALGSDIHRELSATSTTTMVIAPPPAGSAPSERPRTRRPLHKRWWFWASVGGATVAAALGIALGLLVEPRVVYPDSDLGEFPSAEGP